VTVTPVSTRRTEQMRPRTRAFDARCPPANLREPPTSAKPNDRRQCITIGQPVALGDAPIVHPRWRVMNHHFQASSSRLGGDMAQKRDYRDLLTTRNIIAGLLVILALLFVFQNTGTGHFHFLFFNLSAPRWLWLLCVFAAGFAAGILFARHRAKA
jgi:uncharacterized integral membrane protein